MPFRQCMHIGIFEEWKESLAPSYGIPHTGRIGSCLSGDAGVLLLCVGGVADMACTHGR